MVVEVVLEAPDELDWSERLHELGTVELSDLVAAHTVAARRAEAAVLRLACAWADRHPWLDREPHLSRRQRSLAEDYALELTPVQGGGAAAPPSPAVRAVEGDQRLGTGGRGTPRISAFALAEFAVLRGVPIASGHALVADALDLRHRLPRLGALTFAGAITMAMARRAARSTRILTAEQAGQVDDWLADAAAGLGWGRFCTLLEAAVIEADPARAAERAAAAARAQGVWARPDELGLSTVLARVDSGDAVLLLATVSRLTEILRLRLPGSCPTGQLRAKALGLLARPAQALALLLAHAEDADGTDPLPDADAATPVPHDHDSHDPHAHDHQDPLDHDPSNQHHEDELAAWVDPPEPQAGSSELVIPDHRSQQPAGSMELDLAAVRAAVGRAGLVIDEWITRVWHGGAPQVEVVFHLADSPGVVRPEHLGGPVTLEQLADFLTATGSQIKVQPVIDPADCAAVDAYEVPQRLRRVVRTRHPASCFPWSSSRSAGMDLDHTVPFRRAPAAPPGQTGLHNLGPVVRREHLVKTFGGFAVQQPIPGQYLWRTPSGHYFLVTNTGTAALGRHPTPPTSAPPSAPPPHQRPCHHRDRGPDPP